MTSLVSLSQDATNSRETHGGECFHAQSRQSDHRHPERAVGKRYRQVACLNRYLGQYSDFIQFRQHEYIRFVSSGRVPPSMFVNPTKGFVPNTAVFVGRLSGCISMSAAEAYTCGALGPTVFIGKGFHIDEF
ncbi:hypothetical protein I7I51_04481 [Histoplasma capsulatum]|uniref:Uncharacterized protein n=1 Tax=Ajellomyces capsulatus TaxID=5037 RepID=A0A8A1MC56_AJECA|nr:hypothetical protein I7I51_04481 [Histoplasma capsulatum]